MKLFVATRKYAAWVGMHELRPGEKSHFNRKNVALLFIFGLYFISTTALIIFDARTFREYTEGFFGWITLGSVYAGALIMIMKLRDLFSVIHHVEKFVETYSVDPVADNLYQKVNDQIEKWTEIIYTITVKSIVPMGAAPIFLLSYYLYFATDMGGDAFVIVDCLKLPFDRNTPIGYFAASILQATGFILILHSVFLSLGILTGYFGIGNSFSTHIQRKLRSANENYNLDGNDVILIDKFFGTVRFISEIKELSSEFLNLYKIVVTILYIWSMLTICDTLLICRTVVDFLDMVVPLAFTFCAFAPIFLFCELGERIIDDSDKVNNELWMCKWYTYPAAIQRTLPLVINGLQQPFILGGFGNIQCTRESFKFVTSKGYSYFTMFKQV